MSNADFPFGSRPPRRFYNLSLVLILINLIFFFINYIAPETRLYLALNPILFFEHHFYWQILTYCFIHASGFTHLLMNTIGLLFFGPEVEKRMGSLEFVAFYLTVALFSGGASLLVYWFSGMHQVFLMGASGAIYGVLFAFAVYYPYRKIYLFGLIPLRAWQMVLAFTALAVVSHLLDLSSGVAHLTHLAGFLFAFLYFIIRFRMNPLANMRDKDQRFWRD